MNSSTSSSSDDDVHMSGQGFDFPDMPLFDDEDQFPIHEILQREDLEMFSFDGEKSTQGCQQVVVEEAKFFWSANRGQSSDNDSESGGKTSTSGEQQQMGNFFNQTITSAQ